MQLGNKESMVDEKGNLFSPQNLRLQAIDYVALNYSDMYPVSHHHLFEDMVHKDAQLPGTSRFSTLCGCQTFDRCK